MDWDREEREHAIREADRLQAEFERDEWLRAQRAKRSAPEIVRNTYEPRPAQQQPSATMDAITQAAWDTWVKDHIAIALEEHLEKVLTPAMAEVISEIRHQLRRPRA